MWQGIQDAAKRTSESISRAANQLVSAFEPPGQFEDFHGAHPPVATGVPVPSYGSNQDGAPPVANGVPVAGAASSSTADQACFAPFLLTNGSSVLVRGLTSASAAQHNGQQGLVVGYDLATARYTVRLVRDGALLRVKQHNLLQRLSVQLVGLRDRASLNGRTGTIVGSDEARGRYHVHLPPHGLPGFGSPDETLALQMHNLILPPAARVTVRGLTESAQYNGRIGSVVRYDLSSCRYVVQLSESLVLRLKPESVSL